MFKRKMRSGKLTYDLRMLSKCVARDLEMLSACFELGCITNCQKFTNGYMSTKSIRLKKYQLNCLYKLLKMCFR